MIQHASRRIFYTAHRVVHKKPSLKGEVILTFRGLQRVPGGTARRLRAPQRWTPMPCASEKEGLVNGRGY